MREVTAVPYMFFFSVKAHDVAITFSREYNFRRGVFPFPKTDGRLNGSDRREESEVFGASLTAVY